MVSGVAEARVVPGVAEARVVPPAKVRERSWERGLFFFNVVLTGFFRWLRRCGPLSVVTVGVELAENSWGLGGGSCFCFGYSYRYSRFHFS